MLLFDGKIESYLFFQTKVVKYDKVQQERCQPRYKYNCWIEMKDVSMTMDSRICNKVPTRDCDRTDGPIVCQTAFESGNKYIIQIHIT